MSTFISHGEDCPREHDPSRSEITVVKRLYQRPSIISETLLGVLVLGFSLVSLSSCKSDDDRHEPTGPSVISLRFESRFLGQPYTINQRATNIHDCTFEVSTVKFYLSNITLHGTGGNIVLSEIELIDLANTSTFPDFEVPAGSYSGLSFDLGVPAQLNGTQNPDFTTALFDANHPLSESNGMYWAWATGYRFFTFEGHFDTIPNDDELLPEVFSFHTGLDTLFRNIPEFQTSIELPKGATKEIRFSLSIDSLFATSTDTLDLRQDRSFHGNNLDIGIRAANNSMKSFVLDE